MIALTSGMSYVDLQFQENPHVIATAVLHGAGGAALIDPGPSSTLPVLRRGLDEAGIRWSDVTAILLTHIHLDHGGACGTLVHDHPHLRVYVHAKGAPHLINPEKILASATRLYGDRMEALWGECRPVPAEHLVVLAGGERIGAGGRELEVVYTPGHASHHVSYFNRDSGLAFVGDTAGVRVYPDAPVLAPTPPPDVDVEAWRGSLERIAAWQPDTLFLTHFGPSSRVGDHLSELADRLESDARLVKRSLERPGTDAERIAWYIEEVRPVLRRTAGEVNAQRSELAGRLDLSWMGLARYWRKRSG